MLQLLLILTQTQSPASSNLIYIQVYYAAHLGPQTPPSEPQNDQNYPKNRQVSSALLKSDKNNVAVVLNSYQTQSLVLCNLRNIQVGHAA